MNVFHEAMPFFKGNLHLHTTNSDGQRTPEEALALYAKAGYDFVALTDHRKITATDVQFDSMLVLPGIELDYTFADQVVHMIGVGMDASILDKEELLETPENGIRIVKEAGGQVILAHPAWSLNTLDMLSRLRGVCGAEVFNSVSRSPWNGDRADSSGILDIAATHGMLFPFVAGDDTHFYTGEEFCGFIMLQAPALTKQDVLEALSAGRFYASQGPEIHSISVDAGEICVTCSPAEKIIFYSNCPWVNNRCRQGHNMESAQYTLQAKDTFVRVQIVDKLGRNAWSGPIQIK